jgi:hypothetical protein
LAINIVLIMFVLIMLEHHLESVSISIIDFGTIFNVHSIMNNCFA